MLSHFKIPRKLTEITQFNRECIKKAKNGGKTVKYTVNPRYMNTQQEGMKCRLETYFKMYDSGYAFSLVCTKRKMLRCSQLQRVEYDL